MTLTLILAYLRALLLLISALLLARNYWEE
jgi:hypothetical protein